jgi:hypothetical protein
MKYRPFVSSIALLLALSIAGVAGSAQAAGAAWDNSVTVTETISYEDVLDEDFGDADSETPQTPPPSSNLKQFGPFVVVDAQTIEVRGVIDGRAPDLFRRALAAYPGIRQLRMVECPGSEDDEANLVLARMVRRAAINTHVPANGSIRSGGVELFLAGIKRTSEPGAQFGVHSWIDDTGREAKDYAESDPVHREYISFYQEMGFQPEKARAFYAFTNTVAPSSGVHYMTGQELARFGLTN